MVRYAPKTLRFTPVERKRSCAALGAEEPIVRVFLWYSRTAGKLLIAEGRYRVRPRSSCAEFRNRVPCKKAWGVAPCLASDAKSTFNHPKTLVPSVREFARLFARQPRGRRRGGCAAASILEKKFSTALACQPGQHFGMFMGGVIVEDGDLARDVVSLNPDVIFLTGNFLARRFRTLTVTTPIVATMSDPLETGMVQSLARPGGNLTGVSEDAGIEIWGKRLELLKEAVPSMAKLAYVGVQLAQMGATQTAVESAAQRFGVSAIGVSVEPNPAEYGEDHNRPKLQRIAKKRLFSYFRQYAAADVLGVGSKSARQEPMVRIQLSPAGSLVRT